MLPTTTTPDQENADLNTVLCLISGGTPPANQQAATDALEDCCGGD